MNGHVDDGVIGLLKIDFGSFYSRNLPKIEWGRPIYWKRDRNGQFPDLCPFMYVTRAYTYRLNFTFEYTHRPENSK